jgi:hypothetical protein
MPKTRFRFTEGLDTPDLKDTKALLEELTDFTMMGFIFGSEPLIRSLLICGRVLSGGITFIV